MSSYGGKVMCKAAEVGKIVINKCLDKGLFIDTQKLQKLLVLMQIECIKQSGKPLFEEDILIWKCGVAIKEVDEEFLSIGNPFLKKQEEYINLLECENKSVDIIIEQYGNKNAIELNELSIFAKISSLGIISDNTNVPHINYQILVGAFSYR